MQLDIVIPCFNEEAVLKEIYLRVNKILEEVKRKKLIDEYKIIFVTSLTIYKESAIKLLYFLINVA